MCWFAVTWVVFSSTPGRSEKFFFYHFEMEKIALILIYNIFVTKKVFFRNEHQKKILTRTFFVDPVGWRQTNIFLNVALVHSLSLFYNVVCDSDVALQFTQMIVKNNQKIGHYTFLDVHY